MAKLENELKPFMTAHNLQLRINPPHAFGPGKPAWWAGFAGGGNLGGGGSGATINAAISKALSVARDALATRASSGVRGPRIFIGPPAKGGKSRRGGAALIKAASALKCAWK